MNSLSINNREYIESKIRHAKELILLTNTMCVDEVSIRNNYKRAFEMFRNAYYASGRQLEIYEDAVKYGIMLSSKYSCYFLFKENAYWIDCPIILSNFPGTSIGASMSSYCSICGNEVLDCNHMKGEFYNNIECKKIKGKCNICLKESCDHIEGQIYNNVPAVEVIYKVSYFDHISLVDNPEDPEVGIFQMNINNNAIKYRALIERQSLFSWGDDIECLFCKCCSLSGNIKRVKFL